jgi:serine/threonine-protein kinase HipA
MRNRCLYCYLPLNDGENDFHVRCANVFFGLDKPPVIDLTKENLEEMAKDIVARSIAVTGVQPKLSLALEYPKGANKNSRLTIVGVMGGNFILKPQSDKHDFVPENEDLTMHLADLLEIKTGDHSLIRLRSGDLAYIIKRFDRVNGEKLSCEDLCQLSEELTEHKYRGSMEKAGKIIKQYSDFPMLDALNFFELTVFSFITGNADMHLKNFSILKDSKHNYVLSPAYDLLSTKLAVPEDKEEMALTINARKSKISKKDLTALGKNLGLTEKQMDGVFKKLRDRKDAIQKVINISFLPDKLKTAYADLVKQRLKRIEIN